MPFDINSTPVRAAIASGLFVVGLIAGWFGHGAWASPPDVPTQTLRVYEDWRLACPNTIDDKASCELREDVLDEKSRTELAQLVMFRLKGENQLYITVPFNVLLEPGIAIAFGKDKPKLYPFATCNNVGCVVRIKMDEALMNGLRGTQEARILFAGLDGKPVGLPFSLKGFIAGSDAFASAEANRRSWWRRLWS